MISFDAYDLIALWEQDSGQSAAEKAVSLLKLARPDTSRDDLGAMPIGGRDRVLLELRRALFGNQLEGLATCGQCDEKLEVTLHISDFLSGAATPASEARTSLCVGDIEVTFRLPNTDDAVLAARYDNATEARRALLRRCIVAAGQDGASVSPRELDDITLARVSQQMETLDPLSEIRLDLSCTSCEHPQSVLLDIPSYLWAELHAEAERLLDEVQALAREYGWREIDILAMSGQRRCYYLERRAR